MKTKQDQNWKHCIEMGGGGVLGVIGNHLVSQIL